MPFCRVPHFVSEPTILPDTVYISRTGKCFHLRSSCSKNEMVSYKLCLLCKKHHCQKDGWCLQKGIFLHNEGHEKSMSAHYQLFLSLQGYTLSLVKLVQWWKFGFYKMLLLFGASRFRLCPTILYPSKFLVPIHFVGFFQCPPFCVYKGGGLTPWG